MFYLVRLIKLKQIRKRINRKLSNIKGIVSLNIVKCQLQIVIWFYVMVIELKL